MQRTRDGPGVIGSHLLGGRDFGDPQGPSRARASKGKGLQGHANEHFRFLFSDFSPNFELRRPAIPADHGADRRDERRLSGP